MSRRRQVVAVLLIVATFLAASGAAAGTAYRVRLIADSPDPYVGFTDAVQLTISLWSFMLATACAATVAWNTWGTKPPTKE